MRLRIDTWERKITGTVVSIYKEFCCCRLMSHLKVKFEKSDKTVLDYVRISYFLSCGNIFRNFCFLNGQASNSRRAVLLNIMC